MNKESKIPLPQKPKITQEYSDAHRAIIEINDLYPGYGTTIGNALRRVLYSSLEGSAVTTLRIQGASHEFSTLDNILEDVLEISLNIKSIHPIIHEGDSHTLKISAKGKKEVKAKDIEAPSQVEVINPDAHIATLTSSNAELNLEMVVERGVGYRPMGQDTKDKKEIGVISLDAVFSPIVKVNFDVENMRVGDRIDYNRLLLDVTTNGIISPAEAYEQAVAILTQHFTALTEVEGASPKKKARASKKAKK